MNTRKFKSLSVIVLSLVVLLTAALMLSACSKSEAKILVKNGDEVKTTKIDAKEFDGKFMYDVLVSDKYKDTFNAEISESSFGHMVDSLDGMTSDWENNMYLSLYATIDEEYRLEGADPITLDGVTYYATNVGIDALPILEGVSYLFIVVNLTF